MGDRRKNIYRRREPYWRFAVFLLIGLPAWIVLGIGMGLRNWWNELVTFYFDFRGKQRP